MLSRHERQQLTASEQRFTASDPVLAQLLLRTGPIPHIHHSKKLVLVALYGLGVVLLALGAFVAMFSLTFMGVLALTAAACLHATKSR